MFFPFAVKMKTLFAPKGQVGKIGKWQREKAYPEGMKPGHVRWATNVRFKYLQEKDKD
jgi:hypothetical protein